MVNRSKFLRCALVSCPQVVVDSGEQQALWGLRSSLEEEEEDEHMGQGPAQGLEVHREGVGRQGRECGPLDLAL